MRGKIYYAFYLINQYIASWFYRNLFRLFGAKIGNKVIFYKKPNFRGYVNNIEIGNKCYIDKNVNFIINKEGKIKIGNNTLLSSNVTVNAGRANVIIGSNTMIAGNTYIINNDHAIHENLSVRNSSHIFEHVCIEDNVWIGANCLILKGVTIGEGSVIGAGAIVTKDIPPYSVAIGVPCKVKKPRYEKSILIKKLMDSGYEKNKIEMIIKMVNY